MAETSSSGQARKRDKLRNLFSHTIRPASTASSAPVSVIQASSPPTALSAPLPSANASNPSSIVVMSLWDQARESVANSKELSQEEKDFLKISNSASGFHDLLEIVQGKIKNCGPSWTISFKGHELIVNDVTHKILDGLEKFKTIGDIVVNVDPLHAGLPWAGIRLLLQVGLSDREQMAALLVGLHKVVYVMDRCEIYEILYIRQQTALNTTETAALHSLTSSIIDLYELILRFLAKGHRILARNRVSRATQAFFSMGDVENFDTECQKMENRVKTEALICESISSRARATQITLQLKDLLRGLKFQEDLLITMDKRMLSLWNISNADERREILCWISDIPVKDNHYFSASGRTPDTGEWLLMHEQYHGWKESKESMFLWLHGIRKSSRPPKIVISNV